MHPEDPKNRPHQSLSYGIKGTVAIHGNSFFIGQSSSSLNNGSVYIYSANESGILEKIQIKAPIKNSVSYDFGYSISIDEDLLLVGSPNRGGKDSGKAFLYKLINSSWTLIETIAPLSDTWTSDFGSKVIIKNGHILIADRYAANEQGMIFALALDRKNNTWEKVSPIKSSQIIDHGLMGNDIDIYNNRALIGARDANQAFEYIYDRETKEWKPGKVFSPAKLQSRGAFGFAVELDSNFAYIGYPGFNSRGEVQVFSLHSSQWQYHTSLFDKEATDQSYFGASISVNDSKLLIGNFNGERVSYFSRDSSDSFQFQQSLSPENLPGSKFGRALTVNSNYLLIAATYGELAYLYTKNSNDKWEISNIVSSKKNIESVGGLISRCSVGNRQSYYPFGGSALNTYPCSGIDLYSFVSAKDLGGNELNDIWGWTDPVSGKEIALVGLTNGTSFVDVSDPLNPEVIGFLPTESRSSIWRDIKVYKNHAFIVADNASNHGIQIFDLSLLRNISTFTTFEKTAYYDKVGDVHNIAINEETGFAYAVGIGTASNSAYKCGAHIIDINDPVNPAYAGCLGDETTGRYSDGYVHDGQFVIYKGPDADYYGKEIAFTCNETALAIADITDKSNLKTISKYESNNFRYIHQGWLSSDHKYFYVNDELNETRGVDSYQTTLIFDITDLDSPQLASIYNSGLKTIDHNNYTIDTLLYQSNYSSGLRILSIADPLKPKEVAYFDTYPAGNKLDYVGAWSAYPYFKSKTIIVSSIEEGLYVLKINEGENLSLDKNDSTPSSFSLDQNFPNPFNPKTTINYSLPVRTNVSITIYNALGKEVRNLKRGFEDAGDHSLSFDASDLQSGIYFYQLRVGSFIQTRKMSLLK